MSRQKIRKQNRRRYLDIIRLQAINLKLIFEGWVYQWKDYSERAFKRQRLNITEKRRQKLYKKIKLTYKKKSGASGYMRGME